MSQQCQNANVRQFVLLQGSDSWIEQQVQVLAESLTSCVFYSNQTSDFSELNKNCLNHQNSRFHLGTQNQHLIFDARSGLVVDDLCALTGTVAGGGLIVLIIPENIESYFEQYFYQQLRQSRGCYFIEQASSGYPLPESVPVVELNSTGSTFKICATDDQQQAVEAIKKVVSGHRRRPLVITADRGRGKSSALAIAAAELIAQVDRDIVITAPHPLALTVFFSQLLRCLPEAKSQNHSVCVGDNKIHFVPVDQLLQNPIDCALLLVDEAAAIPVPNLIGLQNHYSRCVFSSTVHGYEGAGRGFTVKFLSYLKKAQSGFKTFHLNQPIRWANNDPVEALLFELLLLKTPNEKVIFAAKQATTTQVLRGRALLQNPSLLRQVFALFVDAHYQTKPSDLALMIDDPDMIVLVKTQKDQVLAAVLAKVEGELSQAEVNAVVGGKRRIKGQFSPQTLTAHLGVLNAFSYRYLRIIRIAVQPEIQRQGIGVTLLEDCILLAQQLCADMLTSSFGASDELLSFWLNNHFSVLRLGFTKDMASGEHSAFVGRSVTSKASELIEQLNARFNQNFVYWLCDEFSQLSPILVAQIYRHGNGNQELPDEQDMQQAKSFLNGTLQFSPAAPAISRVVVQKLMSAQLGFVPVTLIKKCLQKHSWHQISCDLKLAGQKAIVKQLKLELSQLVRH